ncbi:MAG: MogA/MoaB family molybdenum cofactor biosynthesis protein [Fimbriimonadaceae bacterium]|nr:MogA/MoaB family molybdenum cofactor biosynthesis protein [Fimbriimonadaceae bacterium]
METPRSVDQHRAAADEALLGLGVITVSDTRTPATDRSGGLLREQFSAAGHAINAYAIVPDEPAQIEPLLQSWLDRADLDAIILNGGTGIASRDRTYDVVAALLEKTLPGFGELFRMLSWEQVGAAAMLSRATAGVCRGKFLVSLPGSTNAVRLALEQLLLPELAHLVWEIRR